MLCMDEKSSVQALDRTQPSLPMKPGRAQTMTHDYKRNGTATLFAALDVLTGKVIGQCLPRHRHTEFVKFLRTIDREVPPKKFRAPDLRQLRHPQAPERVGLARQTSPIPPALHPDLLVVAQPGLERWFRELTDKALRRGVFHSVPDLITKIEDYLAAHNNDPKPFVWTATAEDILAKVARGRVALQAVNQ